MKPNAEQTEQEFHYSYALKRMMNDLIIVEDDLRTAKLANVQGISAGALKNIEGRIYDLKAAIYNAMKVVGV